MGCIKYVQLRARPLLNSGIKVQCLLHFTLLILFEMFLSILFLLLYWRGNLWVFKIFFIFLVLPPIVSLLLGVSLKIFINRDILITSSPHLKKLQIAHAQYLPDTYLSLNKEEGNNCWWPRVKTLPRKIMAWLLVLQGINFFSYFLSSSSCRLSCVYVKCCSWPRVWEICCFWRIFPRELQMFVLVLWQPMIRIF